MWCLKMLIAEVKGSRIDAFNAEKGLDYICPQCRREVMLKKGRKVVHHFAHRPPTTCSWARGETREHMEAKTLVSHAAKSRGLRTEVEFVVSTLPGDRRADVMVWSPQGQPIAFELQHTSIGPDEIERRAFSYASAGISQIWVPFLRSSVWKDGCQRSSGEWFVEKYSPRPFEKWVHGFNGSGGMWMYDPVDKRFWLGRLAGHQIHVPSTTWYSEWGEEQSAGGYSRWSKRFRELSLVGPYSIDELRIDPNRTRNAYSQATYNWPAARITTLVPL
ncbi:competence protein CoiA [Thioclava sp. GXIMD4215]|uniref:competence protein CoiA n=1 Tax=Thioclava sp. GXIMD4215 TaxID=3131928 RepID=UPI003245C2A0